MKKIYITPEEYDRAEKNGVDNINLYRRVRVHGWDKERAITTPLKKNSYKKFVEIAKENGISNVTFYSRIQRGWDPERAATFPIVTKHRRKEL